MFWAWWFLLVLVFVHNEFGLDIISSVSLTIASILTISGVYQLITYMTCKVQSTFKSDLMESFDNLEGAENLYTSYEYEDIGKNQKKETSECRNFHSFWNTPASRNYLRLNHASKYPLVGMIPEFLNY